MKFQNGCWLLKEGFASFSPQQIYDCKITGEEVVICAPTAVVNGRGNTIDGINLTLRITAPLPEVIRVQTWHHRGAVKRGPEFELTPVTADQKSPLEVEETEAAITVRSGHLSLVIGRQPLEHALPAGRKASDQECSQGSGLYKGKLEGHGL